MKKAGMALAGIGVLGTLMAIIGLFITIILPSVAHVSTDEQIPGFIGSGGCCCLSVVLLVVGVVLVIIARRADETVS